jgi:hypothetical protein
MATRYIVILVLALVSSLVAAIVAKRFGKDPWTWALIGLLANLFVFIIFFLSQNVTPVKIKPKAEKGG